MKALLFIGGLLISVTGKANPGHITTFSEASQILMAAKRNDFYTIRQMMVNGVDINYRDGNGNTVYCMALKNNDQYTASILKSFGGTSTGCPGIDPNYKPKVTKRTVYEEKSGIFKGVGNANYLLGAGIVGAAVSLLNFGAESVDISPRSASDDSSGTGVIRDTNAEYVEIPSTGDYTSIVALANDRMDAYSDDMDIEVIQTDEYDAISSKVNPEDDFYSPWDAIGVNYLHANGFDGRVVNRTDDGQLQYVDGSKYSGAKINIALIGTEGADIYHSEFIGDDGNSFDYAQGEIYDRRDDVDIEYDGTDGIPSPFDYYYVYEDGLHKSALRYMTQAAGIMGAQSGNGGMTGVASNVSLTSYAYEVGDNPYISMKNAIENGSDVIYWAQPISVLQLDPDGNPQLVDDYMAATLSGKLDNAAEAEDFYIEQIAGMYSLSKDDAEELLNNLYIETFASLADSDKPIFVVSAGNEGFNDTHIEAAAPMIYEELLGNFVNVIALNENNEIYSDIYGTSMIGGDGEYMIGSNECGATANWCLAAPGEDLIAPIAGTADIVNDYIEMLDANAGITILDDGSGYAVIPMGINSLDYSEAINPAIWDDTIGMWTPLGEDTYTYLDIITTDGFNAGDLVIEKNTTSNLMTINGTSIRWVENSSGNEFKAKIEVGGIEEWVAAEYDSGTGEWLVDDDNDVSTAMTALTGESTVWVDTNGNGTLDYNEYVETDDQTVGDVGIVFSTVTGEWSYENSSVSDVFDFFVKSDIITSITDLESYEISDMDEMYLGLSQVLTDINKDGYLIGQIWGVIDEETGEEGWKNWRYTENINDISGWMDWSDITDGLDLDEDGVGSFEDEDEETYVDFYFIDMDNNGIYTPGDKLYQPYSGAGAATAVVAGSIAALLGAYPHMDPDQVLALLMATADDLGADGVDEVYGNGLINLERATQPYGQLIIPVDWTTFAWGERWSSLYTEGNRGTETTGIVNTGIAISATSASIGTAFGDTLALAVANKEIVVLDEFDRGYNITLDSFVNVENATPDLYYAMKQFGRVEEQKFDLSENMSLSFEVREINDFIPESGISGSSPFTIKSFAFNFQEGDQISSVYAGQNITHSLGIDEFASVPTGLTMSNDILINPFVGFADENAIGARHKVALSSNWSVQTSAFHGTEVYDDGLEEDEYSLLADDTREIGEVSGSYTSFTRNFGFGSFSMQGGAIYETEAFLGSRTEGAFQLKDGTTSYFYGMYGNVQLSEGFNVFGGYTKGYSDVQTTNMSMFTDFSQVETDSFNVGATYNVSEKSKVGLLIAQPLRVTKASATLLLPESRDMEEDIIYTSEERLNMTPTAREIDVQLFYTLTEDKNDLKADIGIMHRFNPGHSNILPDDDTIMMKFKWKM